MVEVSYLCSAALVVEAAATPRLLLSTPVATFLIDRTLVTWATTGLSIGGSVWMLRTTLRRQGQLAGSGRPLQRVTGCSNGKG